ncbi:MAG: hypothetical protein ACOYK8_00150 [Alphaproteobacteria bacterium]
MIKNIRRKIIGVAVILIASLAVTVATGIKPAAASGSITSPADLHCNVSTEATFLEGNMVHVNDTQMKYWDNGNGTITIAFENGEQAVFTWKQNKKTKKTTIARSCL